MSVTDIASDFEHYEKCLSVCHSHYYNLGKDMRHQNDVGEDVFQRAITDRLPLTKEIRMLGIGSGDGTLDCVNFRRILRKYNFIDNTVIEPSRDAIEKYKLNLSRDKKLSNAVTSEWYSQRFEEWFASSSNDRQKKYHFISAVHSLYYVEDINYTVNSLLSMLEDGGMLLMTVESDDSAMYLMSKYFMGIYSDYRVSAISSNEVLPHIDDSLYETTVFKRSNIQDISCCFDETSNDGSLLLDFITQVNNFRKSVSREIFKETLEALKSPKCSSRSVDGRILLKDDWDIIVVRKNTLLPET